MRKIYLSDKYLATLFSNLFSKLARSREPLVRLSNCSLRSRNSGQASWLTHSLPALRQLWTQNCLSDLELSHLQLVCCPSTPTVTRRRNWSIWGDVKRSRRLLLLLRNNINLSEKELYIKPLSLALSLFWNEAWGGAKESEEITGGVGIWILLLLLGDIIGPSAMELFIESSSHFSLHQGLKEGSVKNEIILHPPDSVARCGAA